MPTFVHDLVQFKDSKNTINTFIPVYALAQPHEDRQFSLLRKPLSASDTKEGHKCEIRVCNFVSRTLSEASVRECLKWLTGQLYYGRVFPTLLSWTCRTFVMFCILCKFW